MTIFDEHAVVLVTGISAAGKSTIAEALATRFARGVHVRGDAFRRMVVSGREEMTAQPSDEAVRQLNLRYSLATTTANTYYANGFSVVVQDVMFGRDFDAFIERLRGRPRYVVVLLPSTDAVVRREAERAKTGYPARHHSIAALDNALRNETERLGLWIDTSDLNVEETIAAIEARSADAAV